MKETAKTFTNGLMESTTLYWNKFLLALPRIVMAIILLVIVFYIAAYIARLLKKDCRVKSTIRYLYAN